MLKVVNVSKRYVNLGEVILSPLHDLQAGSHGV